MNTIYGYHSTPRALLKFHLVVLFIFTALLSAAHPALSREKPHPNQMVLELQDAFQSVADYVKPAVVNVRVSGGTYAGYNLPREFYDFFGEENMDEYGDMEMITAGGSGFIVDSSGYIVTNHHVIEGATGITVMLDDGREFKARLIGSDNKTDLAVLKVDTDRALPEIPLGDSDSLNVGHWVVAIGSPFDFGQTVTAGIVSAKSRNIGAGIYDDFIQTDAAINPGNSGGPLVDLYGNVVGVNTAIYTESGGSMGIGFAIPVNQAREVIQTLMDYGEIVRGWLGVGIGTVDEDVQKELDLIVSYGVLVVEVYPGHPAARAGLKRGDVIISFDGSRVDSVKELQSIVAHTPVGETVDAVIIRDDREKDVEIRVGKMPDDLSSLGYE